AHRDDATTGSRQLRDTLLRHLRPVDMPAAEHGPRGVIGRMVEKAERFAPGAGRKHRKQADSDYAEAVAAGNSERDLPAVGVREVPPGDVGPTDTVTEPGDTR
ncbi:MAG TPA: hypothetical protein VFC03_16435, partial [Acidimicrobiales bacterium]|nr:hypothetical protein [Acidimicrobiales bacterium]